MPYPVRFQRSAAQDLARLPREAKLRFLFAFGLLSRFPTRPSPQLRIKQIRGHAGFWRLAIGQWRGIYYFDGAVVRFYMFGPRGDVYNQFESRR